MSPAANSPVPSDERRPTLTHYYAHLPRLRVDLDAVRRRYRAILTTRIRSREDFHALVLASVLDVPFLVSEVETLWEQLVQVRRERADLLAAGRATLAAGRDGEPDPLYYLRDEISIQYPERS